MKNLVIISIVLFGLYIQNVVGYSITITDKNGQSTSLPMPNACGVYNWFGVDENTSDYTAAGVGQWIVAPVDRAANSGACRFGWTVSFRKLYVSQQGSPEIRTTTSTDDNGVVFFFGRDENNCGTQTQPSAEWKTVDVGKTSITVSLSADYYDDSTNAFLDQVTACSNNGPPPVRANYQTDFANTIAAFAANSNYDPSLANWGDTTSFTRSFIPDYILAGRDPDAFSPSIMVVGSIGGGYWAALVASVAVNVMLAGLIAYRRRQAKKNEAVMLESVNSVSSLTAVDIENRQ